jgi:hypothetical protein
MKKSIMLFLSVTIFTVTNLFSQIQVGDGSEINKGLPIEPGMSYTYSQVIYLASEINDGDGGTITQLKWYFNGTSLSNSNNWAIYLGHTTKTTFNSTTDWIPVSAMTQVWNGTFPDPGGAGWITIDITDWNYNGTDNIVVAVDENTPGSDNYYNDFYCTGTTGNRSIQYLHIYNPDPASPPEATALSEFIANIIFDGLSVCCPTPDNLSESNITSTAADLDWTENGTATTWDIQYGPEGFTLGTGTVVNVTSKPYTLTGLNPDTPYDWYVKAHCTSCNSSYSDWSTFRTECSAKSAPYFDDFEAHTATTSAIWGNCWSTDPSNTITDYSWNLTDNGTTPSNNTGAPSAYSGSKYGYTEAEGGTSGDIAELYSPYIDLTGLTHPSLTFFYHMYGSAMGNLHIDINDGSSWNNDEATINGQQQTVQSDPWYQKTVDLASYSGVIRVRFRAERGSSYPGDICIDDFKIDEYSCPAPSNLETPVITSTSARLGWTENGSASSWQIEYGPKGFTPGNGTTVTTNSNPYILTGLSSSTDYDWYIRSSCGTGSYSTRIGPASFKTAYGAHTFPLTENFESGFSYFNNASGNSVDYALESNLRHGGTYCAHNAYTDNNTNIMAETGYLDLSSTVNPVLEFWHIAKTEKDYDKCYVQVSTDGGSTFVTLPASTYFGNASGYASNECFYETGYSIWGTGNETPGNSWWKKEIFELKNYKNSNVQIRFRFTSDGSVTRNGWYIDDIHIYDYQCATPTAQNETDIDLLKATLNWTDNVADNWNLRVVTAGTDTAGKPYAVTSSKTVNLDTLQMATSYDWYVRSVCYNGSHTGWTGKRTFQTENVPNTVSSFPYTESFETGTGDWHQFVSDGLDFTKQSGPTPTANTGPSSAYDGSCYLFLESTNNFEKEASLVLRFDFTGITTPQFSFYYNMYGYYMGTLQVLATTDNGANWTELWSKTGNRGNGWLQKTLYLTNYGGNNNVIIKIKGTTGYETSDMAVDLVDVRESPACLPPEAQSESNYTTSSADLNWTENGTAATWDIEYGSEGFAQGQGTTVNTSSKPYALSGLAATTHYDWYLRADCGSSGKSAWTGPHTFYTSSPPVSTPYFESFDTETTPGLPQGTRTENNNDDPVTWETNASSLFSGTNTLRIEANGMIDMDDWFFTNGIQLTGGTGYELGFMYESGWDEDLAVKYGTEATAASMTNTIILSVDEASSGMEFINETFTPSSSGTYFIGFHGKSSSDGDTMHIDDLYVTVKTGGSVSWNGSTDDDWWKGNNWNGGNPPTSYADVIIPAGMPHYPVVSNLAPANTFEVQTTITATGSIIFDDSKYLQLFPGENPVFKRYIASWTNALHGWHFIASPVKNQNIRPGFVSNPPSANEDFYGWDETTSLWENCKNSQGGWNSSFETTFQTGKGYLVAYGTNQTKSFMGEPNFEDYAVTDLTYTTSQSAPGWHLLGNPYPSALYWNKTDWSLTNIDATAKIWKEESASYVDIPAGTGIIPAMQGFMVHVNTAPGSLVIDASDRTNNSTNWLKEAPCNTLKLTVFDTEQNTAQESIIKIVPDAGPGFDSGYDSEFLPGYAPMFYSISDGIKLSTNALPSLTVTTSIPLGFVKNNASNYYLKAENISGLIPETKIYLTDNKTGKTQLLNDHPVYYFTSCEGDAPQRFSLHFAPTGINETEYDNPVHAFNNGENIVINTKNPVTAGIFVYNVNGQLILMTTMHHTTTKTVNIKGFKGLAIVKVVDAEQVYTNKLIIQ